ncbi:MAG: motility protein A [Eubacteriales bacterium]|nr:motility protein A [Eubacteriales bacterium]
MEITTIIGIVAGFFCICISILFNGSLDSFINWPSVLIVFGGTIAATVVAYPSTMLKSCIKVYKNAFKKKDFDLNKDIDLIINIANIARKEGLLALENLIEEMEDPFLKKGIMLIVDGADTELVKNVLHTEIYFIQERHTQGQAIINSMATYAPAFGMVGTLIGLINMLKNLDDYDALGPGMATALVTTFYGVLLANLVLNPIAKKLKVQSDKEVLRKELYIEGLLSVQEGENSRIIKDKLTSFIPRREVKRVEGSGQETNPEVKEIRDERQ